MVYSLCNRKASKLLRLKFSLTVLLGVLGIQLAHVMADVRRNANIPSVDEMRHKKLRHDPSAQRIEVDSVGPRMNDLAIFGSLTGILSKNVKLGAIKVRKQVADVESERSDHLSRDKVGEPHMPARHANTVDARKNSLTSVSPCDSDAPLGRLGNPCLRFLLPQAVVAETQR